MTATPVSATVTGGSQFTSDGLAIGPAPTAGDFGAIFYIGFGSGDPATLGPVAAPPQWGGITAIVLQTMATPPALGHNLGLSRAYTTPASYSVSVATDFLPIVDATLDAGLPRPRVTFTASGTIPALDLADASVSGWVLLAPGQVGTLSYPDLPSDLLPSAASALDGACLWESPQIAGYGAVRLDPLSLWSATQTQLSCLGQVVD
jgi:hypothetical protein